MRRCLVVVLMLLAIGSMAAAADASTLRVRLDPNDSSSNLDIHEVITNLSDSTVYLRLRSWERFRPWDMREGWGFLLDTFGNREFDRWVELVPDKYGLDCIVEDWHDGHVIGRRLATRPDRKSGACHLPRAWFGHIDRAVRFQAFIEFPSSYRAGDDAPNHGVYRWI